MSEISHCCSQMSDSLKDTDLPIFFSDKFREYGINIGDGGSSFQEIYYCPWCGTKLPESLRDKWFDKLEEMNLEIGDPEIPEEMESSKWWLDSNS